MLMMSPRAKRVYIAGPYTQGDVAVNVRNAMAAASRLLDAGFAPYLPHLTHFWHLTFPRPYEDWIQMDLIWVALCDAVYRIPGPSSGADGETAYASQLRIPVYTDLNTLIETERT